MLADRVLSRVVEANNGRVAWVDPVSRNPRSLDGVEWHARLLTSMSVITAEWSAFVTSHGRLPHIEDILGEDQGNLGMWRIGVLVADRGTSELARRAFPNTTAAVLAVPGLRAALWSELGPGTVLTEHEGPNAGVLRYHLGVECGEGSALRVAGSVVPFTDGVGILFDDTARHGAWNHSEQSRITLFLEIERPLPRLSSLRNRAVQTMIAADPRRRRIIALADEWDRSLNPRGRNLVVTRDGVVPVRLSRRSMGR